MLLEFFDVEHGACALLTCDNGSRIMIDAGRNASTGWNPGKYLKSVGANCLNLLVVTNYDEDHADGLVEWPFNDVSIAHLSVNKKVVPNQIRQLKSEDGMGDGIAKLVQMAETYIYPSNPELLKFDGLLEKSHFDHSSNRFDDENNLSHVTFLDCHGFGVLFPGDLEKAGWLEFLKDENFCAILKRTKILVASHHGRESGVCEEIFNYCTPYYLVISDKGYTYDTQLTVPTYSQHVIGGPFRGNNRKILTTRSDGKILFSFQPGQWGPS